MGWRCRWCYCCWLFRKGVNNTTYQEYFIKFQSRYKFLEMVDLTGCYLVPSTVLYQMEQPFLCSTFTNPVQTMN